LLPEARVIDGEDYISSIADSRKCAISDLQKLGPCKSANFVVEFLQSLQQNVPVGHETERRLSQVRVADAVNHEFLAIGSYVIGREKKVLDPRVTDEAENRFLQIPAS
jgi:hypothetical protein